MKIRTAQERGHADHGWLKTFHTFSFADYVDPAHMGFGSLRVINDDRVQPGQGFGEHPHRDMEIITYVLDGELQHRDSMGNGTIIRPGDVQRMSAGTGVRHSEFNPSADREVHLLQIWLHPAQRGLPPSYEQKSYPAAERRGRFRLVVSPDGADGSVTLNQDARLYAALIDPGSLVRLERPAGRRTWIHVARGVVEVSGHRLGPGDGAGLTHSDALEFTGIEPAEVLVFDVA